MLKSVLPVGNNFSFYNFQVPVFDVFQSWPILAQYEERTGEFQLLLTKILNKYPQGDLSYRTLLFWTVPLLSTFKGPLREEEEEEWKGVDITDYFYEAIFGMKLERNEIFDLVDEVYDELAEEDPDYLDHLEDISKDVYHLDETDIEPNLLCRDREESSKLWSSLRSGESGMVESVGQVFSDGGKYFVRLWLEEGFVNILNRNCLLYVWDVLFLASWSRQTVKRIVTAILILIRFWMFRVSGFRTMRKTFLREPGMIYLLDLKKAMEHLSSNGKIQECPESTNWKAKTVEPMKPFWQELKVGKETVVQQLSNKPISFSNIPGAITSKFKRRDSEDSISSVEETVPDPWLTLWQAYNENYSASIPDKLPRLSGTFDLYIDAIRFLPEMISFAKITGRILHPLMDLGGDNKGFENVQITTFPALNSKARSPSFQFKVSINKEKATLNPHALLHLEIIGFEASSDKKVLVGSTLLSLFQRAKGCPINYGGHQLQVRRGRLGRGGESEESEETFLQFDPVPCCSVLVRLLPAKEKFLPSPSYSSGYYKSLSTVPGATDRAFYKTYYHDEGFLKLTVRTSLQTLNGSSDESPDDLKRSMEQILATDLDEGIPLLDPVKFHKINPDVGMKVCLEKMFGLPGKWERKYFQALLEVIDIKDPSVKHGRYLSQHLVMDSETRSPAWSDQSHGVGVPSSGDAVILGNAKLVK